MAKRVEALRDRLDDQIARFRSAIRSSAPVAPVASSASSSSAPTASSSSSSNSPKIRAVGRAHAVTLPYPRRALPHTDSGLEDTAALDGCRTPIVEHPIIFIDSDDSSDDSSSDSSSDNDVIYVPKGDGTSSNPFLLD